jgi:Flp pilus assembly protein TadD
MTTPRAVASWRRRRAPREESASVEPALDDPSSPPHRVLLGLIIALPLLFGGVHPEVRLAGLLLALGALALKARRLRAEGRTLEFGLWGAALLVASVVGLLQWLPLPAALVGAVSPARLEVATRLAAALGEGPPAWLSLGLDPSRVAGGLSGLALALFVHLLAAHGRPGEAGRLRVVIAVEVAAALVVAVGALHAALGWEGLFDFHGGPHAGGPFPATFVNPNHLAALCLLAALSAFGAAIGDKARAGWHAAMAAIASFGVLASMSRANALLLVGGLACVVLPWLGLRLPSFGRRAALTQAEADGPPERVVRARRLSVGLAALVFIGLVLAGPDRWAIELGTLLPEPGAVARPLSARFGIITGCWGVATAVCEAFPWVGTGVGNLALATPTFTEDWTTGRITHAHHAALEVAGELGLPAAVVVAGLVIAGFIAALRHRGDPLLWGCIVALGALLAQNFVDFSLWIPGVGVPAMALAGLVARGRRGAAPARPRDRIRVGAILGLGAVILVGAVTLAPPAAISGASPDGLTADHASAPAAAEEAWRDLVRDHGADFSALEVAGAMAERAGDGAAARRLAEVALRLNPRGPGPLTRAFKFAVLDGRDADAVSLLERLYTQGYPGQEAAYALALAAAARTAIPSGFLGFEPSRVLRAAEILRARGEGEAARELVSWAIDAQGRHLALIEAWALTVPRTASRADTFAELGSLCLAEAARRAESDPAAVVDWERLGLYLEGEREHALGRPLGAWSRFMAAAAAGLPETSSTAIAASTAAEDLALHAQEARVRALFRAAEVAVEANRRDRLEEALALLDPLALRHPSARGRRHALRSHRLALVGETRNAIRELQQAVRLEPADPSHHLRLAILFEQLGDPEAAARSNERAEAIVRAAAPSGTAR